MSLHLVLKFVVCLYIRNFTRFGSDTGSESAHGSNQSWASSRPSQCEVRKKKDLCRSMLILIQLIYFTSVVTLHGLLPVLPVSQVFSFPHKRCTIHVTNFVPKSKLLIPLPPAKSWQSCRQIVYTCTWTLFSWVNKIQSSLLLLCQ